MWDFYTITHPKARKDYYCDAADYLENSIGWDLNEYEPIDKRIIATALQENRKILKGTTYIKVTGMCDGEWCTFRARKDLDKICKDYGVYEE